MAQSTIVCIGMGPSLTEEDVDYCRSMGWTLATVNNGYRYAPDAKIFHAFDHDWWISHVKEALETLSKDAETWSGCRRIADRYRQRIKWLSSVSPPGYSDRPGSAYLGGLSGYQLIQIASWHKPDRIILLGYDMQYGPDGEKHCHEDHPNGHNVPKLAEQIAGFQILADKCPVPIINATRSTALECFKRVPLKAIQP